MTVQEYVERARVAVNEISGYTQEQVDKLVYEGAKIIYKNAVPLARLAVDETGLGYYEDKICKNTDTPTVFYDYLKDKKSVGIIKEIPELGLMEVAHPVGVVAAITPCTNPTVTPLGNFMHAVKGKNALVISPHPRSLQTTTDTVNLIREALVKCGAPADLIQVLAEPSMAASAELMAACDLVIATGSSGLTKAAHESGTPAYGVGPGNPPAIVDRGYDLTEAAKMTVIAMVDALKAEGVVVFEDKAEIAQFRDALFHDGKLNPALIGKDAPVIAKAAGFDIPETTKVVALKVDAVGKADVLNKEIMGPIVVLKGYDTFENAVDMAVNNMVESGGIGHTAGIFTNDEAHVRYAGERIPVARLLVNQPTPDAWGPATNSLSPAVSEGCGTWGNNILADNVDYIHMLNVSKIVMPLDVELPDGEKIFAD